MIKSLRCAAAIAGTALLIGGCTTYYRVKEPDGGKVYYTTDIEETSTGAVKFKDARTHSTVTLQNSMVDEISEETYQQGVAPTYPPAAPGTPAKQ